MTKQHTILGSSGIIGRTLAAQLRARGDAVRCVDRVAAEPGSEVHAADLLDLEQTRRAVAGSDVVHFAAGLPYENAVWATQFPAIVGNVIAALEGTRTRLVFMDNVYMYGKVSGPMTEDQPHAATTSKGQTRRRLLEQLNASALDFVVARSADFYGPGANANGTLNAFVLQNLKAGRPANWLGGVDHKHSFTYTHDIAAAMAALANAPDVSRTTWHVPTARPPATLRELAELATQLAGYQAPAQFQILDLATVTAYAAQDAVMSSLIEMFYQFDSDYVFDSSRYEARFGVHPTPIEHGLRATIAALP